MKFHRLLNSVLLTLAVCSAPALAHSPLTSSSPANKAQLDAAPETFELKFKSEVKLLQLHLTGDSVDSKIKPDNKQPSQSFTLDLPALKAGSFVAAWRALGSDGHLMKGKIKFTVAP